jgi:hypothetical protein
VKLVVERLASLGQLLCLLVEQCEPDSNADRIAVLCSLGAGLAPSRLSRGPTGPRRPKRHATYHGEMTAPHRTDFIEWARRARSRPTFDLEERDYRLAVARATRALIDAAQRALPLCDNAKALFDEVMSSDVPLIPPRQAKSLVEWAEADEQGLGRALRDFTAKPDDPGSRAARFVSAIESGPGADQFAGGVTVASLLNFGAGPETLPVVHPGRYGRLQELLGEDAIRKRSAVETYRACLAFARKIERLLREHGVPVRDMIDLESLITICSIEHELWAGKGDGSRAKRDSEPSVYLAIAAMIRNAGRHLVEWIEFHRLAGAERFYLYDSESEDDTREVLAPYVDEGIVVLRDWPGSARNSAVLNALQGTAYMDCLKSYGAEARWIAIIDQDEFLFSPTGESLRNLLVEYERWPAVAVNPAVFGTSGHVTPPPGLIIENYTERLETGAFRQFNRAIKNILDPVAVDRFYSPHRFGFTHGTAVDENGYPVWGSKVRSRSFERFRVNHYLARSEQEVRAKHSRRLPFLKGELDVEAAVRAASTGGVRDETIMRFLPALREALARRSEERVAGR